MWIFSGFDQSLPAALVVVMLMARIAIGALWIIAAVSKLPNQVAFEHIVMSFQVLPRRVALLYARVLPWIEAFVGLALVLNIYVAVVSIVGAALALSFCVAIGLSMVRKRHIPDCGCMGRARGAAVDWRALTRSLTLLVAMLSMAAVAHQAAERYAGPQASLASIATMTSILVGIAVSLTTLAITFKGLASDPPRHDGAV